VELATVRLKTRSGVGPNLPMPSPKVWHYHSAGSPLRFRLALEYKLVDLRRSQGGTEAMESNPIHEGFCNRPGIIVDGQSSTQNGFHNLPPSRFFHSEKGVASNGMENANYLILILNKKKKNCSLLWQTGQAQEGLAPSAVVGRVLPWRDPAATQLEASQRNLARPSARRPFDGAKSRSS